MKTKKLIVALLVLGLGACKHTPGPADPGNGGSSGTGPTECRTVDIEFCSNPNGTINAPVVSIHYIPGLDKVNITPPVVCAMRGSDITFNVTPNTTPLDTVMVLPKDPPQSPWLAGNNELGNQFTIEVPAGTTPSDPGDASDGYGYYVFYGEICIDPRVHVM